MILQIFTRDDETGILDGELRNRDIFEVREDTYVPGNIEKTTALFIQIPDPSSPATKTKYFTELKESEYQPNPQEQTGVSLKNARKYLVNWEEKFSPDERVLITTALQSLPDGDTAQGGTVTSGVVYNLFSYQDILRK